MAGEERSLVHRTSDFIVSIVMFIYYVIYYILKGRDPSSYNNDPSICVVNTPILQPLSDSTNVCCVHGIQTKIEPKDSKKKDAEKSYKISEKQPAIAASHTEELKKRFDKKTREEKSEEKVKLPEKSLVVSIFGYFTSFFGGKTRKSVEKTEKDENLSFEPLKPENNGLITTNILPPPAPQVPENYQAFLAPKASEPRYPPSLIANKAHLGELREKLYERSKIDKIPSSSENSAVYIESPPTLKSLAHQTAVYTNSSIKRSSQIVNRNFQKNKETQEEEEEEEEESSESGKNAKGTLHFAKSFVHYQSPQKATVIIKTLHEDDHSKSVQVIRSGQQQEEKNFSRKTNELVYPETGLLQPADHGFGGQAKFFPITVEVQAEKLAATVNAAAMKKSKYNEELAQQVRACQNIARELKFPAAWTPSSNEENPEKRSSAPMSPSVKAQQMFVSRKNRMQKWVYGSTEREEMEEEAASSSTNFETNIKNVSTDDDQFFLKKLRSPFGVHDIADMSKTFGENLLTNIASPEKCHELSSALIGAEKAGAEKSVEFFQRRKQRSEKFVVNDEKAVALPPPVPRHTPAIAAVIESVHEAAARRERMGFRPLAMSPGQPDFREPSGFSQRAQSMPRSTVTSPPTTKMTFDLSVDLTSKNRQDSTRQVWSHERFFSPVPFSSGSRSRCFTPVHFSDPTHRQLEKTGFSEGQKTGFSNPQPGFPAGREETKPGDFPNYNTLPRGWRHVKM